jgi:DNA repair exonuclease SbcCD nuclease subunit
VKIVHAADIHLDSPMRGLSRYEGAPVEAMRGATRRAFSRLVDLCLEEEASLLLIAGDLYDGDWKDYSTGLFFLKEMRRLREGAVEVVLLRGNHDAASQIARTLKLPEHVRELATSHPETVELGKLGIAVHGQGFAHRAVTDDLSKAYPAPLPGLLNVGLLHTSADGRPGHEPYAPCKVERLVERGYDYWALGHVHKREVLAEAPWVVFPGNLQGRHARETGPKGATLITASDGRIVAVEPRVLDVARWELRSVDVAEGMHLDDVLDASRRAVEAATEAADAMPMAIRLVLRGTTALSLQEPAVLAELRGIAASHGEVWLERILVETRAPAALRALRERDDGLGQLLAALTQGSVGDEELRLQIEAALAELRGKLPDVLREREELLRLEGPAAIDELLGEVERTLVPRLLAGEEE